MLVLNAFYHRCEDADTGQIEYDLCGELTAVAERGLNHLEASDGPIGLETQGYILRYFVRRPSSAGKTVIIALLPPLLCYRNATSPMN